jgi:tripartite-type tricarboxylate transporter receptor subunit TctC
MTQLIRIVFIALALLTGYAQAQNYPDRTIRIIVGFTPGSATDISARMFAQKLGEAWSVPVAVENLPGGGGSIGGERVGKSAPDGYTLYWGANGALTINPSLQVNPTFEPLRDLAPVARLLVMPSILAVNNDVPARRSISRARCSRASSASTSCTCPIAARTSST